MIDRLGGVFRKCLGSPFVVLAAVAELALSRRSLCMAFVLLAALLAFYGGLRPPLHHDLKSVEVPFGASTDLESSPEALLDGRRQFRLQSPGGVLLVFLGVMALIVLRRPQHLAVMAGGLLVASFVLGADLCLNHPRLVELIDSEREERRQIVDTLRGLDETSVVQARGPDSGAALAPTMQVRGTMDSLGFRLMR